MSRFAEFFRAATGQSPFPYQRRLAESAEWPARIEVPTGLGKTLAVVMAWLWRRREGAAGATPRRLIYCLPMRVLVEQTREVVVSVVQRLGLPTGVVTLMGGVDDGGDWDTQPEDDAILIGTQDMLLSRALNRGYGMSRYRWPLHFGLLNTDCLWIIDEVQLVGSGVTTTAQLQALRRKLGTVLPSRTSWMSATLEASWLETVDIEPADVAGRLGLEADDLADPVVAQRVGARKAIGAAASVIGDTKGLSVEILAAHQAGTRTLVVVNTVDRARAVFLQLRRAEPQAELVLLHSRFRSVERDRALARAVAVPDTHGTIVVSTQVIEAGVDVTSTTLFTEVAPWASLVQRFGRCNRRGEDEAARVRWIGLPSSEKERAKLDKPYTLPELLDAQVTLARLVDVGPASLPAKQLGLERGLVLRRRDLLDLFDTTPDLMGNDVDVSRFIRDTDDQDVRVCWRAFDTQPDPEALSPARAELCAVPIGIARDWWKDEKRQMWVWDALRGRWAEVERMFPGLTLLLRSQDGGYDATLGLAPKSTGAVPTVDIPPSSTERDDRMYDGDPLSEWAQWYTLRRHSDDVAAEAGVLTCALRLPASMATAVTTAGRWHDAGKAHRVWQAAARRLGNDPPDEPVAKSQARGRRIVYERRGFRHELVSALLALQHGQSDLVCFLIACHHGKVRVSLRALPTETVPRNADGEQDPTIRHARGVWEGDWLEAVDLGGGLVVPATMLTLSYMVLGDDDVTGPSWLSRVLALRDDPALGPFRLGFFEGLVKCADERASRRVASRAGGA